MPHSCPGRECQVVDHSSPWWSSQTNGSYVALPGTGVLQIVDDDTDESTWSVAVGSQIVV